MTSRGRRWLAGIVVVATALPATAARAGADDADPAPGRGADGASGVEAIQILGDGLAQVARDVGWTPARLRHELTTDDDLKLATSSDRLYYVDRMEVAPAAVASGSLAAVAPAPLEDTFALHSRPGAPRTIYIDANGHTTTGTEWNTVCDSVICEIDPIESSPFDLDGTPETFNDDELAAIQGVWARVADDYDMFDIDVTTEEPPLDALLRTAVDDTVYGQRAVLTRSNFYEPSLGVAFIGSFGDVVDTPVFVFNEINGTVYSSPTILAHGVSHEVGHSLGLSHDGSTRPPALYSFGTSAWGPIMGGAGVAQYVTWSKGEYAYASNSQDDLAVMQSFGAVATADAVGDTTGTATLLPLDGANAFGIAGRIETRTDKDVYALDINGTLKVTVAPTAPFEANLDLELRLLNASGSLIVSSNPSGRAAPSITRDVTPGRYYLQVDGVGQGSPSKKGGYSDYASLGGYTLAGTAIVDPTKQLIVSAITPLRVRKGLAKVTVTVVDGNGTPVRSAIVRGKWDGSKYTTYAYTNSKGVATFYRYTSKDTGFTTTKVSKYKRLWDGITGYAAVPALAPPAPTP